MTRGVLTIVSPLVPWAAAPERARANDRRAERATGDIVERVKGEVRNGMGARGNKFVVRTTAAGRDL